MKIYTHRTKNDLTAWAPIRLGGPNKIWGPVIDLPTLWKIFSLRPWLGHHSGYTAWPQCEICGKCLSQKHNDPLPEHNGKSFKYTIGRLKMKSLFPLESLESCPVYNSLDNFPWLSGFMQQFHFEIHFLD